MSDRRLAAALAAALTSGALLAWAQPAPEQTVWLKNGGFVRGTLVELVPGDHITLQLVTGEIRKIPASEIDRTSGATAPSASVAPAPQPPAGAASPPASSPSPASPASPAAPTDQAMIRVVAPAGVELQARPRLSGAWTTVCAAPCGSWVSAVDREFRASGPGFSPSRPFLIEPGTRPTMVEVRPGSASSYRWGQLGYLVGTPLLLLGGVGLGLGAGTQIEHHETLKVVGLATVIVSGLMIVSSLPLLYRGQTRVLDGKGSQIARKASGAHF